jgi:LmbE family N-acetylglucosaminyl deacetylase
MLGQSGTIDVHWVVLGADSQRAQEAHASAERFLGGARSRKIVVRGFRDSYFPYLGGQIKEFVEQLRGEVAPNVIFTHRREDMHQDHRLVAELTWCAFRDHLILEYEIPKYEGDLGWPNFFVPLDEPTCRLKVQTIVKSFPTQHAKKWFSEDTYWALLRIRGLECNSTTSFAEAFHCRKLVLG